MAEVAAAGRRRPSVQRSAKVAPRITGNPPTSAPAAGPRARTHRPWGSSADASLGPAGSCVDSRYSANVQQPNTRSRPSSARMPQPGRRARSPRGSADPFPESRLGGRSAFVDGQGVVLREAPPPLNTVSVLVCALPAFSALTSYCAAPVSELEVLGVSSEPATVSLQHGGQTVWYIVCHTKRM